jgi:hypothetical protein
MKEIISLTKKNYIRFIIKVKFIKIWEYTKE